MEARKVIVVVVFAAIGTLVHDGVVEPTVGLVVPAGAVVVEA